MAKTTVPADGRMIPACRTADVSPGEMPSAWSPPKLTGGPTPRTLRMRLSPRGLPAARNQGAAPEARDPSPQSPDPISPEESLEHIAARRPADLASAVRTLMIRAGDSETESRGADLKIATLLLGLGADASARVIRHCSDDEVERIARAVTGLSSVAAHEKDRVFGEFRELLVSGDYLLLGGEEFAGRILTMGLRKRGRILMARAIGSESSGFQMLAQVDPSHIASFIAKEHPQTVALILSQLDPDQSARVLRGLPEDLQLAVSHRLARLDNVDPDVLEELQTDLAHELQAALSGKITPIGGPRAVSEILNRAPPSLEKKVLEYLDNEDSALAEEVREAMFLFDDLLHLTDRSIQVLLKEVDPDDLAVALKGANERVQERFLSNASDSLSQAIKEKMQYSGPLLAGAVEEKQALIVQKVGFLRESGKITVRFDSSAYIQ